MKFSTIMAVFAVALAVVTTGCRYDKSGAGDGMGDGTTGINTDDLSGTLPGDAAHFEDLYARCTDVDLTPVYFGFDSTVVPQGEMGKIDACVSHLQSHPKRVVVIEGHCDERGSTEYNMSLGENRAQVVRGYLVSSGISSERIQTRSYGAEKPAVDGHDESAWKMNRRGEFAIFDTTVRK